MAASSVTQFGFVLDVRGNQKPGVRVMQVVGGGVQLTTALHSLLTVTGAPLVPATQ
jgi:hypothetical protein